MEHNCDRCVKGMRMKPDTSYTQCRCGVQEDIFRQMFGMGDEPCMQKSVDAVSEWDCKYILEHWPLRRGGRRAPKGQLEIQFE